jgi:hypothetical protein
MFRFLSYHWDDTGHCYIPTRFPFRQNNSTIREKYKESFLNEDDKKEAVQKYGKCQLSYL